jgi:hypothetical protein
VKPAHTESDDRRLGIVGRDHHEEEEGMTTNDPSTSTRAVLCFQDAWDVHCSTQLELKDQTVSGSYDGNEDADVSSVFFELANAPSISYRLQASDSIDDDDDDDSNNGKSAATKTTSNHDAIVIRQDVSAETHTGGIVWETSFLLLNYLLSSNNWLIRNRTAAAATSTTSTTTTILELGAGCKFCFVYVVLNILNNYSRSIEVSHFETCLSHIIVYFFYIRWDVGIDFT